ncbi:MAG: M48 family metallopeptidase [Candidatus Omnitrophica bacterium]|nr:M48 family metallopeptidase [Candidatus Omnitrophota bacterium]
MNIYLVVILCLIIVDWLLETFVAVLNLRNLSPQLPPEFSGLYEPSRYKKSQEYLKESTGFSLFKNAVFTAVVVIFILAGGFNFVDVFVRGFKQGPVVSGLFFAAILMLGFQFFNLPFAAYRTFVIEEKYGFNKTTIKTFILDIIKSLILGALIAGTAFSVVLWFFGKVGRLAWIYCWLVIAGFELFLVFVAPVVILPLFNKFIPLEEGPLKTAIEEYARREKFALGGIFKMDASRRSAKSNAFFTGFGRYRRIALFDTLIEKHAPDELVSVIAHEVGHYKKKHIIKGIALSILTSGFMFFLLSFFIENPGLFKAFKMENLSIYASLFFFTFLYSPINLILSIFGNSLSRKHEYEADSFAVKTHNKPEDFIRALKKLSVDNLSNLNPHPLKVFLHYSHPPVLKRIQAIRKIN